MMIALIPVPLAIANLNQLMMRQRFPAVDAQILLEIGLHQRQRGVMRIHGGAEIGNLRFSKREGFIHPLPDVAVILGKTHP